MTESGANTGGGPEPNTGMGTGAGSSTGNAGSRGGTGTETQPPPPGGPPLRKRLTHISAAVCDYFKSMLLSGKFDFNAVLLAKNKKKDVERVNNLIDKVVYPDVPSENASFITIDEEDRAKLRHPEFRALYRDRIPEDLMVELLEEDARIAAASKKREAGQMSASQEDAKEAKRRCISGENIRKRKLDETPAVEFHQILFDTENNGSALPLSFFTVQSLGYIISEYASLPTQKANIRADETKKETILDVAKLEKVLGKESDMTYGQWLEASEYMLEFHMQRDKDGPTGEYAVWWNNHFAFFTNQQDKEPEFIYWRQLEANLRKEFRQFRLAYNAAYYAQEYRIAKIDGHLRRDFSNASRNDSRGADWRPSNTFNSQNKFTKGKPFPSGTGGNPSTAGCLICAQRGHGIKFHQENASTPARFMDGKNAWAKIDRGKLCSPDGKELCISYNLRGVRGPVCDHKGATCAHICSFCGSDAHHTLAWACRSAPQA